MNGWLLDTNVVSELRKPHCDKRVKTWADAQPPTLFFLSRITIAEIRFGIEQAEDASFRRALERWLASELRVWFADRMLDLDEDVIVMWRRMVARGKTQNHTFAQPDLVIAATAAVHDLCVATRNIDDFLRAGVSVFNPWTDDVPRKQA